MKIRDAMMMLICVAMLYTIWIFRHDVSKFWFENLYNVEDWNRSAIRDYVGYAMAIVGTGIGFFLYVGSLNLYASDKQSKIWDMINLGMTLVRQWHMDRNKWQADFVRFECLYRELRPAMPVLLKNNEIHRNVRNGIIQIESILDQGKRFLKPMFGTAPSLYSMLNGTHRELKGMYMKQINVLLEANY